MLLLFYWLWTQGSLMKTIKELRMKAGMSQMKLAIELGVTVLSVSNWERRTNEPRASQVRAMAQMFGVIMDDIDFEAINRKEKDT